jgi:hypothetical protein
MSMSLMGWATAVTLAGKPAPANKNSQTRNNPAPKNNHQIVRAAQSLITDLPLITKKPP